jgi:hypothetical protein
MVLLVIRNIAILTSMFFHSFYVSVCEIYHNPKSQALEVTIKIFTDDLELALSKDGHPDVAILEAKPDPELKNMLQDYLRDRFRISVNSKPVEARVIGYEFEDDALLCFVEIKKVKDVASIDVYNSIITEVYEDQVNLTHFQYHGTLKSLKMTKENPSGSINSSDW